jgi:cytochrome P450/ferredoxin
MTEVQTDVPTFPVRRESPFQPPAAYAEWRESEPVKKVRLPDGTPAWVLTRHDDVREMLGNLDLTDLTADRMNPKFPKLRSGVIGGSTDSNIVFMDEPDHGRIRRMLSPSFTAKKVTAMRPGIQQIVDRVIDEMLAGGSPTDLHQSLSMPVPSLVICQLLGTPYDDHDLFQRLTGQLLSRATTREDFAASLQELTEYLHQAVMTKDENPSADDMIGRLIIDHVRTGELTHKQVVGLSMLMLVAGHETTGNTISMGVLHLLHEPDKLAALQRDPSLVAGTIEELLRIHSINDLVTLRLAAKDFEIRGCPIKAGDGIIGLGAAANHDPDAFPNPSEVDPSRAARTHLGFGFGVHACIGQNLARAELEIVFTSLLERVPTLQLDTQFEDLSFKHDGFVFGVNELPVAWQSWRTKPRRERQQRSCDMARVIHDRHRCQSMGVCESLAANVFELNDDAELVLLTSGEVSDAELDNVRAAVAGCPNEALRLVED